MSEGYQAELAKLEAEARGKVWRDFCELPGPRTAHGLRLLLGLTASRAAKLAGLPLIRVSSFERSELPFEHWHFVSRRLHHAYAGLGATWCEPALHEGAYCVSLDRATTIGASDQQAVATALALMGHRAEPPRRRVSIETLVKRLADRLSLPPPDVRAMLRGRAEMTPELKAECFRQLGEGRGGAGVYFDPAPLGGWRTVGCDFAGCWW